MSLQRGAYKKLGIKPVQNPPLSAAQLVFSASRHFRVPANYPTQKPQGQGGASAVGRSANRLRIKHLDTPTSILLNHGRPLPRSLHRRT